MSDAQTETDRREEHPVWRRSTATVGQCSVLGCPMTLVNQIGAGRSHCCWLHWLQLGLPLEGEGL